jgi:hypothetical protein
MSAKRKPDAKPKSTSAARTRAYRERMRAKGLKPVTRWVLDLNNPAVRARLEEDGRRIRESPDEQAVMDMLEQMQIEDGIWG